MVFIEDKFDELMSFIGDDDDIDETMMVCYQLAIALDFDIQSVEEQLLSDDRVSIELDADFVV